MIEIEKGNDKIQMHLLTPLTGEFFPDEMEDEDYGYYENGGEIWDGRMLVSCGEAINRKVEEYNQFGEDGETCNLMDYFHGSDSIRQKVESAVVSVKDKEGILVGCTTLILNQLLEREELNELCDYITGQYSDGWGEGFEQQDIPVEGGYINVHFWQGGNMEFEKLYGVPLRRKDASRTEQKHQETTGTAHPKRENKRREIER